MFDRVRIKGKAKDQLRYNQNLSGMVGANFLYRILKSGVSAVVGALSMASIVGVLNTMLSGVTVKGVASAVAMSVLKEIGLPYSGVRIGTTELALILPCLLWCLIAVVVLAIAQVALEPVKIGLYRYHMYIEKNNRRTKVVSIFDGFDSFMSFAYAAAIRCIWVILIPAGIWFVGMFIALLIGVLCHSALGFLMIALLVCAGAWVVCKYFEMQTWMMPWLLADNPNLDAKQARVQSKRLTQNHLLDLFVFELSFYWTWGLLSKLTAGIVGLLYGEPYYHTACALAYEQLKGGPIELRDITLPAVAAVNAGSMAGGAARLNSASSADVAGVMIGIAGMYTGSRFPLEANRPVIIGRDATQASIVLSKGTEKISRRHCTVMLNSATNQYEVTDHSSNGVYVGTRRLAKEVKTALPRGTEIMLGSDANIFRLT